MKLEGVRVLDLSLFLPGPMLTLMMADHGADVIKIEPPGEGEPTRHIGAVKNGVTVWFRNTHRGKRSIQLDLKTPGGLAEFLRLARDADVVIESFRPGVADRLGVGYDQVRAINASIVYCSISAFGQDGAYRLRPAHDLAVQALAGTVSLTEGFDMKPAPPGLTTADALSSLVGLSAVLMALLRREKTGQGDFIDVSMLDSMMAWMPSLTPRLFATGEAPVPKHERGFGGQAMNALYECKDGRWIVLGGSEVKFARNLLEPFGRLDLLEYAALPPGPGQAPLAEFLRAQFKTRTQAEWIQWFEGRDICFAPVRTLKEAFDDPVLRERGMLCFDEDGNEVIGTPIRFRNEPGQIDSTLPELGEHAGATWRPARS